jgi:hypothetical protein
VKVIGDDGWVALDELATPAQLQSEFYRRCLADRIGWAAEEAAARLGDPGAARDATHGSRLSVSAARRRADHGPTAPASPSPRRGDHDDAGRRPAPAPAASRT